MPISGGKISAKMMAASKPKALMGWSDLATAQRYIRISGTATADALRRVHHR
jgi:hypothetical protein